MPKSCQDVQIYSNINGVYTVYPFSNDIGQPLTVYCDQTTDNGGWMVKKGIAVFIYIFGQILIKLINFIIKCYINGLYVPGYSETN